MQYYVVGGNGERYGPATVDDLNTWASEGRVNVYSMVVADGSTDSIAIASVPGFKLEALATTPPLGQQNFQNVSPYMRSYEPVQNHLVKAILATIFCCQPFGIVAIVFSAQVDGCARSGDIAKAKDLSQKANMWANISIGVNLALIAIYIIGFAILAATGNLR